MVIYGLLSDCISVNILNDASDVKDGPFCNRNIYLLWKESLCMTAEMYQCTVIGIGPYLEYSTGI